MNFKKLTTAEAVVCVNSWVSGAMLILRWLGVGYDIKAALLFHQQRIAVI
jgi:hypothetical protein